MTFCGTSLRPTNLDLNAKELTVDLKLFAPQTMTLDPEILSQVFSNLLSNAEKYAPGSHLSIESQQSENTLTVSVRDSGPGIERSKRQSIFEPFVRLEDRTTEGRQRNRHRPIHRSRPRSSTWRRSRAGFLRLGSCLYLHPQGTLMKILIVEDDTLTREGLAELLQREGYTIAQANNGSEGLLRYREFNPDLVCLDVMMPEMSGYDVCREIRKTDLHLPVVFITAKSEEIDTVVGLELGADDYIAKPFGKQEVLARIRALIRRANLQSKPSGKSYRFIMDDLEIVPDELRAYRDSQSYDLSPRDIAILEHLFQNRGRVVDRDSLFDAAWGSNYMPNSRSLDQHISQLRKRIEKDPKVPTIIKTVHGAGYRFE